MFTRYTVWQLDADRYRVLPSNKRPPDRIALAVWRGRAIDPMAALIIAGIVR